MKMLLALVIAAVALLIVACGGDDATATPTRTATPTQTATAPPATPTPGATMEPDVPTPTPGATMEPDVPTPTPGATMEPDVPTPTPGATALPTATTPPTMVEPTGTVLVALPTFGREGLDPGAGINDDMSYYGPLFDWLIGVNKEGQFSTEIGALTNWEMSPDALVWTLTLRDGMTWHDGVDVTSQDGVWTLQRYARDDAACIACGVLKTGLESGEVVDGLTFRANFKTPNQFFTTQMNPLQGDMPMLPKHHWDVVQDTDGFNSNPMGSGPWTYVNREIGEFIEFEANLNYWNPNRKAEWAGLRLLLVPESTTQLAMVEGGDADMALLDPRFAKQITDAGLRIMGPKSIMVNFIAFNESWDPAQDTHRQEIRRAANLAIDMEALVEAIYPEGTGSRAVQVMHPLHEGYNPDLEPYPYDPAEARRILQSLNAVGTKLTLYKYTLLSGNEYPDIQEAAAAFLQVVGFDVEIVPTTIENILEPLISGRFNKPSPSGVFRMLAGSSTDLNLLILLVHRQCGGIVQGFWDADRLCNDLDLYKAELDPTKRQAKAREIINYVHNEYGTIPVSLPDAVWAVGPRVANWEPIPSPFYLNYVTISPAR